MSRAAQLVRNTVGRRILSALTDAKRTPARKQTAPRAREFYWLSEGWNFDGFYELGPDSLIRRGVPKGTEMMR